MRRVSFAVVCAAALTFVVGCGSAPYKAESSYGALPAAKPSEPPAPAAPPAPYALVTDDTVVQSGEVAGGGGGSGGNDGVLVDKPSGNSGGATTPVSTVSGGPTNDGAPREMFDVEARLTLQVEKLADARTQVRKLVEQYGGNVTSDELSAASEYEEASFELRIPSTNVYKFLDGIDGIGKTLAREVKARDVGKEYHDDLILLENLERTMHRYEELLAKAQDVKDMLEIESQLSRVRTQIEQVKGNLQWLKDRVARSTVYLRIVPARPGDSFHEPEAKLYPGIRATYLLDYRKDGSRERFAGFGLSLHFARYFSIDLDGMRGVGDTPAGNGLQAFVATMGGDFYSDYFGKGERKWLNPYLGARLGYARVLEMNDFVVTGLVGLEIFKTKTFMIDLQGRVGGFFGSEGSHVGLQPSLALNVAF